MKVIIQFPNEKMRNVEDCKKIFEEFFKAFTYLDIAVDLTNVKRELMELRKDGT